MIKIRGHQVPVDVRTELERYDWTRPNWSNPYKFLAASPFRHDNHPSFFVNTDPSSDYYGTWRDSGAVDSEWGSGNFVKLLAFLRNETYDETADYLLAEYGALTEPSETTSDIPALDLSFLRNPAEKRLKTVLNESLLDQYRYRHPYLGRRGISEAVQRMVGVGYCRESRAVTIPWRHADGTLANVKYRKVDGKTFWYARGGHPIRSLVYGLDIVYRRKIRRAALVEAEICAMSIMTAGTMAIATGGSVFTEEKAEAIRKSPLEEIVIFADHDAAGQRLKRQAIALLGGHMTVRVAGYPIRRKDANEVLLEEGKERLNFYITKSIKTIKIINVSKNVAQNLLK